LRLETDVNCDKKKSELYFVSLVKKILTEISCEDGSFFQTKRPTRKIDGAAAVAHHFSFDGGKCGLRQPLK
jgi:hypothetical protein